MTNYLTKNNVILGLVCLTAPTSETKISFKTITKTSLNKQDNKLDKLFTIYIANIVTLQKALDYCYVNNIGLYRISSNMFPFIETVPMDMLEEKLKPLLNKVNKHGIRLVCHPDQFCVLSSDDTNIVKNSIEILKYHALIFDWLNLAHSPYNAINIHGGKGNRITQLSSVINDLPDNIKSRLTLENDEFTYSTFDLYSVFQNTAVPILFDFHHELVYRHGKKKQHLDYSSNSMIYSCILALSTWANPDDFLTHLSNGKDNYYDRKHSDYIEYFPDVDNTLVPFMEIEAKAKDLAIYQLLN